MSFSFAVLNGDLVQQGSSLGIVYGINKLTQDMTLWVTERYGIDPMHPTMGSLLQDWIGGIINTATQSQVQSEILRVLQNYQAVQYLGLKANPQKYSLSELLQSIQAIDVSILYDTISVSITVANANQQSTTVTASAST